MKKLAIMAFACCLAMLGTGASAQKAADGFRWEGSEGYQYNLQTGEYSLTFKIVNTYGSNGMIAENITWALSDSLNRLVQDRKIQYAYDDARNNTGIVEWVKLFEVDSLIPFINYIMTYNQNLLQTMLSQFRDEETGEWTDRQLLTYLYNDKGQMIRLNNQRWDGVASWIDRSMNTCEYSADGDKILDERWVWNRVAREFQHQSRQKFTYNTNHDVLTDSTFYCMNQEGTEWYLDFTVGNIYRPDGLLAESHEKMYIMDTASLMAWYKRNYEYDDKNRQTDMYLYRWNDSALTWVNPSHEHMEYDDYGNLVKLDLSYWDRDSLKILPQERVVYLYSRITGIREQPVVTEAVLYPNPFTDRLTIMNAEPGSNIQVLSNTGQIVHNETFTGSQLHLSGLKPGVYTVRILGPNGILTKKIIKN